VSTGAIRLTKWYLDVVSDEGDVLVGHVGRLVWRGLAVRHASILSRSADGTVVERWGSQGVGEPAAVPEGVRWRSRRPGIDGTWAGTADGTAHRLLSAREGFVDWTCLVPSARVSVVGPGGCRLEGRGYAERLEMTLRPWRLPIEELRWGRFCGEAHSLVWIEWRGPSPMTFALLDGHPAPVGEITDEGVVLKDRTAVLSLMPLATLREGRLGPSVLARIPGLAATLPVRALGIHETRWLSAGVLETGGDRSEGAVLHEVVRWPKSP
jgi:hypothetical protein